ncbi:MAG: reverse transcriptase domain-containing protein, partial [Planctomycetota bacterium]
MGSEGEGRSASTWQNGRAWSQILTRKGTHGSSTPRQDKQTGRSPEDTTRTDDRAPEGGRTPQAAEGQHGSERPVSADVRGARGTGSGGQVTAGIAAEPSQLRGTATPAKRHEITNPATNTGAREDAQARNDLAVDPELKAPNSWPTRSASCSHPPLTGVIASPTRPGADDTETRRPSTDRWPSELTKAATTDARDDDEEETEVGDSSDDLSGVPPSELELMISAKFAERDDANIPIVNTPTASSPIVTAAERIASRQPKQCADRPSRRLVDIMTPSAYRRLKKWLRDAESSAADTVVISQTLKEEFVGRLYRVMPGEEVFEVDRRGCTFSGSFRAQRLRSMLDAHPSFPDRGLLSLVDGGVFFDEPREAMNVTVLAPMHRSGKREQASIEKKFLDEQEKGWAVAHQNLPPYIPCSIEPFGAVSRRNKLRRTTDKSWPRQSPAAVNAWIDVEDYAKWPRIQLPSLRVAREAARAMLQLQERLQRRNEGCRTPIFGVTSDFRAYYNQFGMRTDARARALHFMPPSTVWEARVMQFGGRIGPQVAQRVSNAIIFEWRDRFAKEATRHAGDAKWFPAPDQTLQRHYASVYIDDFLGFFFGAERAARAANLWNQVAKEFGIPIATEKDAIGRQVKGLGAIFDFDKGTLEVDPAVVQTLTSQIRGVLEQARPIAVRTVSQVISRATYVLTAMEEFTGCEL